MKRSGLLFANTRQTLSRFRALLVALVGGMVLLLASATVVGSAVAAGAESLDTASELSALELMSNSPSGVPRQLTPTAVESIRALPGVEHVVAGGSVGGSLEYVSGGSSSASAAAQTAFAVAFSAVPRFEWMQPSVVESASGWAASSELAPGQVLLPNAVLGTDLTPLVGAEVTMEYSRRVGENEGVADKLRLKVVGVYDNSSPRRSGDAGIYLCTDDFRLVFGALIGAVGGKLPSDAVYSTVWVKAASVAEANRLARELTANGYYVNSGGSAEQLPRALSLLKNVNLGLAVLLALFGLGIGMTLASTWSRLRRWDVGVLTSLGWSPGRILLLYGTELAIAGLAVGLVSGFLGVALSVAGSLLAQGHTFWGIEFGSGMASPPWSWVLGVILGTPAALILGASGRIARLSRVEPDDALRRAD